MKNQFEVMRESHDEFIKCIVLMQHGCHLRLYNNLHWELIDHILGPDRPSIIADGDGIETLIASPYFKWWRDDGKVISR